MTSDSASSGERSLQEVEYVDECPACKAQFLGLTPEEYRETHAAEDCPDAPLASLHVFPGEDADG